MGVSFAHWHTGTHERERKDQRTEGEVAHRWEFKMRTGSREMVDYYDAVLEQRIDLEWPSRR